MFQWLKNIFLKFGGKAELPTQKHNDNPIVTDPSLDLKIQSILAQKKSITNTKCDWYTITISNPEQPKTIAVFKGKTIETDTLAGLKAKRIAEENERIAQLESSARYKLAEAKVHIQTESVDAADKALTAAYRFVKDIKNDLILNDYRQLRRELSSLRETLRLREIEKQEAERRAREEQERKRLEEEQERMRKFQAEQKAIEEQRAKEAKKFEASLLSKEKKEQKEREKLSALDNALKDEANEIKQLLARNDIKYLYHFTARVNLQSIKNHGGLYSWKYCKKNNITIPEPGGDETSWALDELHGLADYVRLSFCDDHPMAYRLRDKDLVLLIIKIDVAWLKGTLYSDINAAALNHQHGSKLKDLQLVDFNAVKRHYVSRDDEDFGAHQAEVLVKTHIPAKYILNLDDPIELDFE